MLKNIENYIPQEPVFVINPKYREMYPATIFDGAKDLNEVLKSADKYFNAEYPSREKADRKLDAYEITEIRGEYCHITENDLPMAEEHLICAIEEAKRIKTEAEKKLETVRKNIAELASRVKIGVKDIELHPTGTMRIALAGNYVYYTWCGGKMQLAKVERIPEHEKRTLWSEEDKNREAMKTLFGIEFPEVVKPIDEDNKEQESSDDDENEDKDNREGYHY